MTRTATCPGCGGKLRLRADQSGKKIACGGCGKTLRLPNFSDAAVAPAAPQPPPLPESVTFCCSLCDTRITVPIGGVGKRVKCPDCHRLNVVPPPPAPVAPQIPAAMSGEQYEVWGVDEAPSPRELAALQPRLFAVECRLCQTLMYASEQQLGSELPCPDCGVLTLATKPKAVAAPPAPASDDGNEYELDETSAPQPRPVVVPVAIREAERLQAARDDPETLKGRERRRERLDVRDRPILPAAPLLWGVSRMLLTSEVIARGIFMAIYLSLVAALFALVMTDLGGGGRFGGGMGAIAAICFGVGAVILGTIWYGMASVNWLAVLTESSEGHDRLYAPPSWNILEWMGEAFYLLMAASMSGVPAWLAWKFSYAAPEGVRAALAAAGWLLCFPVAMLSSLHEGSPMGVVSPRLLSSLMRRPGPWLIFYVETALLAAAIGFALWRLAPLPGAVFAISPLLVAAMYLYMRLLGRLAWWLAETMPEEEEDEDDEPA